MLPRANSYIYSSLHFLRSAISILKWNPLMLKNTHPFHIVAPSPWPLVTSLILLSAASMLIQNLHFNRISLISLAILIQVIIATAAIWWRDVKREATIQGHHTSRTLFLLKYRIIIFIISEVIFFLRFFWAYFHRRISPNIELGRRWPPNRLKIFNPIEIPLLNSIILLSSGATITWAHHSFLNSNINKRLTALIITITLGILFSGCQGIEYIDANFTFSDSVYGSTFFLATGFHGIHVLIGTIFLIVTAKRIYSIQNSTNHFICFDLSAWYWHFVDVVWLFLFISIYWWGS